MQLEIGVAGTDESLTRALLDWIQQERIEGASVELKTEPIQPGRLGADFGLISVVLGAPAVVALVGCLRAWITARRPETDVTIKRTKAGFTLVIHTKNISDPERLFESIRALLEANPE